MPNPHGRGHSPDWRPARAFSPDIALFEDDNDEVFVTEWDESIRNCGNGWVRTYRCPTSYTKRQRTVLSYQDITKEIYSIPSVHREERASHGIGPNQNDFYRDFQPNRTVWSDWTMHSKSRTSRIRLRARRGN